MRVLVTGAGGQVGHAVRHCFEAAGHEVHAFDSKALDITDTVALHTTLSTLPPLDALINCAAYTAVDRAETEPERAFLVNATACEYLARACAATDTPLVHLSTDYVFDGHKNTPYTELDTPAPLNVYGASKLAGEQQIQALHRAHLIVRVSGVFGAVGQNFVKTISRLARERPSLRIVADQHIAPTGATHIAQVLLTLLSHPQLHEQWGLYHYCDAPATTWFDFASTFIERDTCQLEPISYRDYPTPAQRPVYSVLGCAKIAATFGINPAPWQAELTRMNHAPA